VAALQRLRAWLTNKKVTHVVMESTGSYWIRSRAMAAPSRKSQLSGGRSESSVAAGRLRKSNDCSWPGIRRARAVPGARGLGLGVAAPSGRGGRPNTSIGVADRAIGRENPYMDLNESQLKIAAAASAVRLVRDGMIVGLGSGSTAAFAVNDLGERVKRGLLILGIPTSERTAAQAHALGIPLTSLAQEANVDITIDGADEVEEGSLNLIKGHGGALLRETIVACASKGW
jgi:hypothetical protein